MACFFLEAGHLAIFVALLRIVLFFTAILPRLRFSLLAATLLLVVGLNNQAVATFRLPAKAGNARVSSVPKGTVVKQKVTLEATSPLAPWLLPALDGWFPPVPAAPLAAVSWPLATAPRPRPCAVPDWFHTRLLEAALSPHAP
ncbi:hypothetical protein F0P96_06780 [Hymenobacter busanensis]|uniref:Uncharacterized protein n=1 Tax=Hymenobacter busanensis TaxID=2607656 RepID=A0A7L5A4I6_9BACT|nr:hypothetical protein [Hymenobacter busanensis]KAA9338532.1 hypothetical protein F0P96_06780 [Hymenobacter busanensis]QHJ09040.1 hypothetical protein GUY19_17820 [Hymenobacter busanensis]